MLRDSTIWFDIRRIYPAAALVIFLLTSFACSDAVAAEPKRVMLLHSDGISSRGANTPNPSVRNWIGNHLGDWTSPTIRS
jgi:hypothetical protein